MANKKSRSARKIIIFSIIGLTLVGLGVFAYFHQKEVVFTVQTEKVLRRNLVEVVEATGKIQPVLMVKISPEVSGEIIELPVKEGQNVKKGDLLLKIKPDAYVAQRDSADANTKSSVANKILAQANVDKANSDFERAKVLFASKLISDSDFIAAKNAAEVTAAQLNSALHLTEVAQAALDNAQDALSKTTIYSPLDGTISQLNSRLGERVVGTATMAGTDILTISDLSEMEAQVDIGETDVVLIKTNQVAKLEVDSYKDRIFNGFVTDIANTAKVTAAGTQTEATKFQVKIRVKEKEPFRPGMSVTAKVETRYRTNVLVVPIQSVTTRVPKKAGDDDKKKKEAQKKEEEEMNIKLPTPKKKDEASKPVEVVFVPDGDKVKMVKVKRGISDDSYHEIIEGMTEGQEVISGGYKAINRDLEDGKKIKVDNAPKPVKDDKKP